MANYAHGVRGGPEDGGTALREAGSMATLATTGHAGTDMRRLMPGSSPSPPLRRPARAAHGRYMSNDLEREYARRADQLDALEQDIRRARKAAARTRPARREPPPAPHGEPALLADGTRILIRPIEVGDAQELRAGFGQLGIGSRYQRFLAPIAYLTQHQLDYLTQVDHETHEALVAVDAVTGEGIGVARFVRDARDPERADVAIVVADRWQGHGAGTLLAERLAARARMVGVKSFTARMLAGNQAARRLVERVGHDIREREDGGAIVLTAQPREHVPAADEPAIQASAEPRASIRHALAPARHAGRRLEHAPAHPR